MAVPVRVVCCGVRFPAKKLLSVPNGGNRRSQLLGRPLLGISIAANRLLAVLGGSHPIGKPRGNPAPLGRHRQTDQWGDQAIGDRLSVVPIRCDDRDVGMDPIEFPMARPPCGETALLDHLGEFAVVVPFW